MATVAVEGGGGGGGYYCIEICLRRRWESVCMCVCLCVYVDYSFAIGVNLYTVILLWFQEVTS